MMKQTRIIMGMPIAVEVIDGADTRALEDVFAHFVSVDNRFSTYKGESEIMRINRGEVQEREYSADMREIFDLSEKTRRETNGYFNIRRPDGTLDPSGVVKGWSVLGAANFLVRKGYRNFYVDAGGDIQSHGKNGRGEEWSVGIRNPFKREEVIKVVYPRGKGIATSGTYVRGDHIYNPHNPAARIDGVVSITVIGPNVLEADRFATAAFAMGTSGIAFIESLPGFEGYAVGADGTATMTSGFEHYTNL